MTQNEFDTIVASSPDMAYEDILRGMIWEECRQHQLEGERDVWTKVPQILNYGDNWVVTIGAFFQTNGENTFLADTSWAGFVPVLSLGEAGVAGFAPMFVHAKTEYKFPQKEEWLTLTKSWDMETLMYVLQTVTIAVQLPF